jgi:hypothetical protein
MMNDVDNTKHDAHFLATLSASKISKISITKVKSIFHSFWSSIQNLFLGLKSQNLVNINFSLFVAV